MPNQRTKEIADWIVRCAKWNCDVWEEKYENDLDALEKSHESTYLEDEEDMMEEFGYSEKEIDKAWKYLNGEKNNGGI
jgi:Holliday junction resolvasome RuvABC DNA-binding subunit